MTTAHCSFKPKQIERLTDFKSDQDERVSLLYSAWSCVLTEPTTERSNCLWKLGITESNLPNAPHLENCKAKSQLHNRLDTRIGNDSFPPWTSRKAVSEGTHPPWVCFLIIGTVFNV